MTEFGPGDEPVVGAVEGVDDQLTEPATPPTRKQSLRKIVIRVLVMAIGIGVAGVLLVKTFDDLDLIRSSTRSSRSTTPRSCR